MVACHANSPCLTFHLDFKFHFGRNRRSKASWMGRSRSYWTFRRGSYLTLRWKHQDGYFQHFIIYKVDESILELYILNVLNLENTHFIKFFKMLKENNLKSLSIYVVDELNIESYILRYITIWTTLGVKIHVSSTFKKKNVNLKSHLKLQYLFYDLGSVLLR